jgi:hypothetical protein
LQNKGGDGSGSRPGLMLSLHSATPVLLQLLYSLYNASFSDNFPSLSLTWRNWQTRTAQDRMGQPVEVRVLS